VKKKSNKNRDDLFRESYKSQYLVYNRKSTDEPENQKNSIQYQKSENTRFAFRENLPVAPVTIDGFCTQGIISERHSAFKEDSEILIGENGMVQYKIDRPKFHKMLDLLNRGYFKGVIVLCWDRITRNKADETIIRKLMKQGVDFRFVLASYDKTSSGALHMDIDGMFAAHHSRVTSEKVSINIRNQREKGICTYKAPIGYLNVGRMDHKPFDPIRAPIIKRIFELYATGEHTVGSITRFAQNQGLTMPPMRRRRTRNEILQEEDNDTVSEREKVENKPAISSLYQMLHNEFYTGKVRDNFGGFVASNSHEPLISEELFKRVQNILKKKKTSIHYSEVIEYPYRGMIRCYNCKRVFSPYLKKGHQYFSSRCQEGCTSTIRNFNIIEIEDLIDEGISRLRLTPQEEQELDDITTTEIAIFNTERINNLDDNERAKKKIRDNLCYMQNNKLELLQTGVYTPHSLIKHEETLQAELKELQNIEVISDEAMFETIKEARKLSELLKNLTVQDISGSFNEKQQIVRILFSELYISDNILLYKCNPAFEAFEMRLVHDSPLLSWILELSKYTSEIKKTNHAIELTINSPISLANIV